MTYSIGFRAPSRAELVRGWCEHQTESMLDEDRYADPDLVIQAHHGEITASSIDKLHAMVLAALSDRETFARWFGAYNSQPKYPDIDWRREQPIGGDPVREFLAAGGALSRNPASRFTFVRVSMEKLVLFVDGHSFDCSGDCVALAEKLCAETFIEIQPALSASAPILALITLLIDQGSLAFDDEV